MAHRQGGNLVLMVGEVRCSYHLIDKMQKNMNIKYMQRNMNINIDQMNIDRILKKTTYQYYWKNAGAMTKSRRERVNVLRSESET